VVTTSNPDLELLPGMTASLSFQVDERADVIKVPNAALRFYPVANQVRPVDAPILEGKEETKVEASLRKCSGSGTMIRSQIFKWKGCGERTEIGRFRKVDRTVAKPVEALILRERKLLKGSGSRRHSRQSRPVKNTTGLRRGCSRKLGQTSDWRRSRRAERVGRPASE